MGLCKFVLLFLSYTNFNNKEALIKLVQILEKKKMVHHFNKKNIPILKVILEINGLVLVFFLVIAVLSELGWLPYFINSMAPV